MSYKRVNKLFNKFWPFGAKSKTKEESEPNYLEMLRKSSEEKHTFIDICAEEFLDGIDLSKVDSEMVHRICNRFEAMKKHRSLLYRAEIGFIVILSYIILDIKIDINVFFIKIANIEGALYFITLVFGIFFVLLLVFFYSIPNHRKDSCENYTELLWRSVVQPKIL